MRRRTARTHLDVASHCPVDPRRRARCCPARPRCCPDQAGVVRPQYCLVRRHRRVSQSSDDAPRRGAMMTVTSAFGVLADAPAVVRAPGGPTPIGECLADLVCLLRRSEAASGGAVDEFCSGSRSVPDSRLPSPPGAADDLEDARPLYAPPLLPPAWWRWPAATPRPRHSRHRPQRAIQLRPKPASNASNAKTSKPPRRPTGPSWPNTTGLATAGGTHELRRQ